MLKIDRHSLEEFSAELKREAEHCSSIEELLKVLYQNFKYFFNCDHTIAYKYDVENARIEGVTDPKLNIELDRYGTSLTQLTLKSSLPIVENNIENSFIYNPEVDNPLGLDIHHWGGIPVVRAVNNIPLGLIVLYRKDVPFSREDFHRMETLISTIRQFLRDSIRFKVENEGSSTINFKLQYLKATEKLKSSRQFFFSIIHDIRTPLNAMMGFLQLLLQKEDSDEKREFIKSALHSGKMIVSLINDLLDMAKLEEGKLQIEKVYFTPITLFESTTNLFYFAAKNKNVELIGRFDPSIPFVVYSDNYRLQQVLNNLLSNAVKFTPEGGKIYFTLTYQESDAKVRFSVKDTGIGIPKEAQARLFKPYEQVSAETSKKFGGTGLGLYISHKLVSMLGGELQFVSEEGKGTEFFFSIPVGDLEADELPPTLEKSLYPYRPLAILLPHLKESWLDQLTYYLEEMEIPYFTGEKLEDIPEECKALFLSHQFLEQKLEELEQRCKNIEKVVVFAEIGTSKLESQEISLSYFFEPILPRKLFVQPAPKVEATSTTASSTVRVVVADDDPVSQNLMIHLFKSLKAEVKAFPDGEEAYNYFKDHSDEVDIIFLDQNMPRMGGIETAKAIRNLSDKVPIYILSGEQEEELRRKLGDIKVNGILTKPVNLSHLERILNRLR